MGNLPTLWMWLLISSEELRLPSNMSDKRGLEISATKEIKTDGNVELGKCGNDKLGNT